LGIDPIPTREQDCGFISILRLQYNINDCTPEVQATTDLPLGAMLEGDVETDPAPYPYALPQGPNSYKDTKPFMSAFHKN
jgi:hypothetical protein